MKFIWFSLLFMIIFNVLKSICSYYNRNNLFIWNYFNGNGFMFKLDYTNLWEIIHGFQLKFSPLHVNKKIITDKIIINKYCITIWEK